MIIPFLIIEKETHANIKQLAGLNRCGNFMHNSK